MAVKALALATALLCAFEVEAHQPHNVTWEPILNTRLGRLRGTVGKSVPNGRPFFAFRGIPYAKPPVGNLRWKDPVPYGHWTVPLLNATAFGPMCPQYFLQKRSIVGDEDCLYMNVYTPKVPKRVVERESNDEYEAQDDESSEQLSKKKRRPSRGLPVMVWFHGGAYLQGSANNFGPELLLRENVVLVTVNYRLGVLGFLSTGDKALPGNFGALDMVEALKWVRNNIADFGGNPKRVTIFGQSAGGASSHLLSLSPLAKGLFHRVISMSGQAVCNWAINEEPLQHTQTVGSRLDCSSSDSHQLVACLRDQSTTDLILASYDSLRYTQFPISATPVVDKSIRDKPFLPDTPMNIMTKNHHNPVPMMSGLVENESFILWIWALFENLGRISSPWYLEQGLLPGIVDSVMNNRKNFGTVIDAIKKKYFTGVNFKDFNAVFPQFSEMLDDLFFTSCAYETQSIHSEHAPVYAYVFDYKGEKVPSYGAWFIDIVRRAGINHPMMDTAVSHFDELFYLFNLAGHDASYSDTDMQVSLNMTKLWVNFAATGMPTPPPKRYDDDFDDHHRHQEWYPIPHHSKGDIPYYRIGAKSQMSSNFRKQEHRFWTEEVVQLRNSNVSVPLACYEAPCDWN